MLFTLIPKMLMDLMYSKHFAELWVIKALSLQWSALHEIATLCYMNYDDRAAIHIYVLKLNVERN